MYYFSYISNSYSCKNKLEEAVYQQLRTFNRRVIPNDQLDTFKKDILEAIEASNQAHPRCKPVKATFWCSGMGDRDFVLSMGGGICNFNIYASKV